MIGQIVGVRGHPPEHHLHCKQCYQNGGDEDQDHNLLIIFVVTIQLINIILAPVSYSITSKNIMMLLKVMMMMHYLTAHTVMLSLN